jgi:O-antigen ligase
MRAEVRAGSRVPPRGLTPAARNGAVSETDAVASVAIGRDSLVDSAEPQVFGFRVLLAFLFVYYSGVLDITIPNAKIPLILGLTAAIVSTGVGGLRVFVGTGIGRCNAILTALMLISVPFSVWPRGSLATIDEFWTFSLVLFFTIPSLARSVARCQAVVATIALARLFAAITSSVTGGMVAGRLVMASSRFSDPNDLALAILMAIPMWFHLRRFAKGAWLRLAATPAILLMIAVALRTGSRGGLVGAAVMVAFLLLTLQSGAKLKLATILIGMILASIAFLPGSIRARYSTLFSDTQIEEESREGRKYLLKQSITLTLQNPLLGVGPGMFAVAEDDSARLSGLSRGLWHGTHNMYTQVSSEVGIPAAVVFCTALVLAYRKFRRIAAQATGTDERTASLGFWLSASLVGFCGAAFFLGVAYEGHVPALLGLATALDGAYANAGKGPPSRRQERVHLQPSLRPSEGKAAP